MSPIEQLNPIEQAWYFIGLKVNHRNP
jgi:hypothetical protein